jgi:hypothetical protein
MGAFANVQNGQENYEFFTTKIRRKTIKRVQYDYRDTSGELFSCIAPTLETARKRRNQWLANKNG